MAMMKCKDCGKEISTSAAICPKCGTNLRPPILFWAAWLILAIGVVMAVIPHANGAGPAGGIFFIFLGLALLIVRAMRGRAG